MARTVAKGVLSGFIWGSAICLVAVGVASVVAPPPVPPSVGDTAPRADAVPEVGAQVKTAPRVPDAARPVSPDASTAPAPSPDTITTMDPAATDPAALPETGGAEQLAAPGEMTEQSGVSVEDLSPVLPNPQAMAPQVPGAETDLSISTDPAQPPAPAPVETEAFVAPDPDQDASGRVGDLPAPDADTPVADARQPAPPAAADTPEPGPDLDTAAPAQPEPATPQEPDAQPNETAMAAPEAPATTGPAIGSPAGALDNLGQGVTVNRLPNLGTASGPADTDANDATDDAAPVEATGDMRPISRFAAPFENPEGKPLMAIVLIDSGQDLSGGSVGVAALRSFPYPISFAIDTSLPDAARRMADYRAEGFEVLALVDLPQGATATDAEVSLAVALNAVPEAVAVIEGVDTGLQTTREAANQVTAILSETGHGFVTQNEGLNTVQKLAAKAGVPSAVVFRDFDSKGQTPTVIRRFLDQAAFRASQDGGVIMLGRVRPDTISALLLWGLQDRAEQVALAPVSAVLTGR
ncbi:divergent polysaccharide deacetylase family protein [Sulfitobacter sabulilitoris]|uniref:divergent polysaccharide deacetylase family protein n=1 Tax=Sulfitobacter sabulilitoris TaxID=2562655 RepID=UPI001FE38A2D|nr:divergent polysaccharide deacetylase family protein [Sulfitobacter sabulilitoris]